LQALAVAKEGAQNGDGWDKAKEWRDKYQRLEAETEFARNEAARERTELIDDLINDPRVEAAGFTDEYCKNADIADLRRIKKLASSFNVDYTGRGGPHSGGSVDVSSR
jgi:hypothetical protein